MSWAKVAIGAVAPTVLVVKEAADALVGKPLSDEIDRSRRRRRKGRRASNRRHAWIDQAAPAPCRRFCSAHDAQSRGKSARGTGLSDRIVISATINDEVTEFLADERDSLLDALRDRIGLTGRRKAATTATAAPAP